MPVRVEFTEDGLGVLTIHEGVVICEMLKDAIFEICKDERFSQLKYWIGDRTQCTEFLPDAECFKEIADYLGEEAKRNPDFILALVGPTDVEFGMSRMLEMYAEKYKYRVRVFRDRQSADEWIREVVGKG